MSFDASKVPYNIELIKNTLTAIEKIPYWCYDPHMNLLRTNSKRMFSDKILRQENILEQVFSAFCANQTPAILSADFSLFWGFVCETDNHGAPILFHVLGPILGEELSEQYTASQMRKNCVPLDLRETFSDFLHETVILPPMKLFTYLLMLHYCASGQILTNGDIRFLSPSYNHFSSDTEVSHLTQKSTVRNRLNTSRNSDNSISSDAFFNNDRRRTYMAEQMLLQMIRDGNIHYQKALDNASSLSSGVQIRTKESITQARISAITFTTLAVRAAIEGGLTPEMAYSRGDAYLQSISVCNNYSELINITHQMYEDFIQCVHNLKKEPVLSPAIQTCCDYIHTHLEEKLSLSGLARRAGYTEYYLSRKFASETGISIGDYIKRARIEQAKLLLANSYMDIADISEKLCFSSRNFFSKVFREKTGITPASYRTLHRK